MVCRAQNILKSTGLDKAYILLAHNIPAYKWPREQAKDQVGSRHLGLIGSAEVCG